MKDKEFSEYLQEVESSLREIGYSRYLKERVVREDFENGKTVQDCVSEFVDSWGDEKD